MVKILKQQTATSYPVYYCETSADLQKLSTFAPIGSIAYENGKQHILNSLRKFAALEYMVNLNDIQLPPDVEEKWEAQSLKSILNTIDSKIARIVIEIVGKVPDNDSTIISGMSKTTFISKINAGEFVDIKILSKLPGSGGIYKYVSPRISEIIPYGKHNYTITISYSSTEYYTFNILDINGWVED